MPTVQGRDSGCPRRPPALPSRRCGGGLRRGLENTLAPSPSPSSSPGFDGAARGWVAEAVAHPLPRSCVGVRKSTPRSERATSGSQPAGRSSASHLVGFPGGLSGREERGRPGLSEAVQRLVGSLPVPFPALPCAPGGTWPGTADRKRGRRPLGAPSEFQGANDFPPVKRPFVLDSPSSNHGHLRQLKFEKKSLPHCHHYKKEFIQWQIAHQIDVHCLLAI